MLPGLFTYPKLILQASVGPPPPQTIHIQLTHMHPPGEHNETTVVISLWIH